MRRRIAVLTYLAVARHLPASCHVGGSVSRTIRGLLARHMLASCGRNVNVEHGARFGSGRHLRVGDNSGLGIDSDITGPVDIGRDVMMGPRVTILTRNHEFSDTTRPMIRQGHAEARPVVIEDDVWIGVGVIILPGVRIGRGAVVGAGAVVTRSVEAWRIVGGNPARVIGCRAGGGSAVPRC
jgi:maltose O-acetyltransferase